jgi:transcription attenuation protein (tryptophan RNA-binding attenuator protein)
MDNERDKFNSDFIVVRAEENGVNIIGLTRGKDTKFHHTEKLDKGEVLLAQFTENTSAIKIRGKAIIKCRHGEVLSGDR